jgi:DnaJ domain
MSALHRRHLPRATVVTFIAAILAIGLTLALVTPVDDLASTPASSGVAGAYTALHVSTANPTWNLSPFAPLLSAPPPVPWSPVHP